MERQRIGIIKRASFREDIWNLPNVLTMGRIAVIPLICWLLAEGTPLYCLIATWLFGAAAFTFASAFDTTFEREGETREIENERERD